MQATRRTPPARTPRKVDFTTPKSQLNLKDRLLSKIRVNPETGCWEWTARLFQGTGYAQFKITVAVGKSENRYGHRVAYELLVGPIPDGLFLDHLCRNKKCINPQHLEPVTARTNALRGFGSAANNARKTHCKNGHPLSGDNLYHDHAATRQCRICQRERSLAWKYAHLDLVRLRDRTNRARRLQMPQGAPGEAKPAVDE